MQTQFAFSSDSNCASLVTLRDRYSPRYFNATAKLHVYRTNCDKSSPNPPIIIINSCVANKINVKSDFLLEGTKSSFDKVRKLFRASCICKNVEQNTDSDCVSCGRRLRTKRHTHTSKQKYHYTLLRMEMERHSERMRRLFGPERLWSHSGTLL